MTQKDDSAEKNVVRVEGDIVFVKRAGETQLRDVQRMCKAMEDTLAAHGRGFWLFDLKDAGGFGAEARKWAGEWEKQHAVTALAAFGGSLEIRSLTKLIATAVKSSSPLRSEFIAEFFNTEAEARAWIDAQRARLTDR
ncbi:STAS/SEC14 domain-containing protein [Sorangium sp. So ce131]|uniref:STAS/SEC14 domain-containing protein n=1 Tax=Sorangium sp. So ce131 TaxID=3133282 RepID=UPI003F6409E2